MMVMQKYGGQGQDRSVLNLRSGVPSGTIIGRMSSGTGAAEFLQLKQVIACRYIVAFSYVGGVLGNNQLLGYHDVAANLTFPPNFGPVLGGASQAGGDANAAGSTVITIQQASSGTGSFSSIGTITIGAGGITPTFATAGGAAISVAQGHVIRAKGPSTADATFANFFCTLVASTS